jgi:hypothetical protein
LSCATQENLAVDGSSCRFRCRSSPSGAFARRCRLLRHRHAPLQRQLGFVVARPGAKHTDPGPPIVSAGEDGFVIQSPTGDYRLQFGLLLQADGRFDAGDDDGEEIDTFALRRVRPQLHGRIAERFEFFLNPDFAGGTLVLQDAYLDTRFSPAFIVRIGKGKTPSGSSG